MSGRPQLLLRADGGPRTGIGHLMRCLALGQAWRDRGGTVALASACLPASLGERLAREGFERIAVAREPGSREDAELVAREARARDACVILDGYGFGPEYQETVAGTARRLLLVADHGRPDPGPVDLLVDQNLDAALERYPGLRAGTRGLLGPHFALLRRELRAAASTPAERRHPPRRLLVTLGGGDDGGLGERLLEALGRNALGLREVTLVAGPAHPAPARLEARLRDLPFDASLVRYPEDVVPLIQRADVALSAAGSTCWELACLGLPAVVVPIADNQEPVAAALADRGVALSAGRMGPGSEEHAVQALVRLADDGELFESLRERGMLLVDGEGASRVARSLHGFPPGAAQEELTLRGATPADARLLWSWVNDPEVREASFSSAPIPWPEHRRWLAGRLSDPGARIYVALDAVGEPVGQIRFEGCHDVAELAVSLSREARGRGIGPVLIAEGARRLFEETAARGIDAFVKTDNDASRKAFRSAGFIPAGATSRQGQACERFHLKRP